MHRAKKGDLPSILRRHASDHSVPGAALGILYEGSVTTAYYGSADIRTGEPVTAETRFSVGSLTKPMVATLIVRLAEEGRLSLDDPVRAHVPELRGEAWAGHATVRDLLANRSGLPLSAALEFGFAEHTATDDGALSRLASELAGEIPGGAFWSYSNVGWCLLGRLVETAADSTWEDAMRRHLFDNIGMGRTMVANAHEPAQRAVGYDITPSGPVAVEPLVARAYGPAGTSVVSTVTDLLRFAALNMEDASLAQLRTVHAAISIYGWLDAWGLGWARFDWERGEVWGWDGLLSGERSALRMVPAQQGAIALMTNGSTGRAMQRSLFADLMPSLFGIEVPPLRLDTSPGAAGDLGRYTGVYGWPDREVDVRATVRGLLIGTEEGETEALPLDERVFLVEAGDPDNPTMTFADFDSAGRPAVLYDMLWGLPRLRATG